MKKSCNICAQVYSPTGEKVDSKLFSDLLSATGNDRTAAIDLYALARDSRFLEKVRDKATFDENGEITMHSLLKLSKTSISQEGILKSLNKEIKAGEYSFQEAIQRLQQFNKNSQWNDDYMATIDHSENGKYKLSVIKKTSSAENALIKTIANQTLKNRLIAVLAKHGVAVDFLRDGEEGSSRYSTENIEMAADGFYHLIRIASGEHVEEDLAEESGHFAVAALGNNPLVKRLLKTLSPEVQKQLLGDEYDTKHLGKDPRREVAGSLVGKALAKTLKNKTPWEKLAYKIATAAKKIFYKLKRDKDSLQAVRAKEIAKKIAEGFLSPNYIGTLENALSTKETLYSANVGEKTAAFKRMVNQMAIAAKELKSINSDLSDRFEAAIQLATIGTMRDIDETAGPFAESLAVEGITELLDTVRDILSTTLPDILSKIDIDSPKNFSAHMAEYAKMLREARIATSRCFLILDTLNNIPSLRGLNGTSSIIVSVRNPLTGRREDKDLGKISRTVASFTSSVAGGYLQTLLDKERQFFAKVLADCYGSNYVNRAQRVLFGKSKDSKGFTKISKEEKRTIEDYLIALDEEDMGTWFTYSVASMSNNPDVIGQLYDKVVKSANKTAGDMVQRVYESLKVLQKSLEEIGIKDPKIFYERGRDGELTGNFISKVNWGDYERDYEEWKREKMEEFKEAHRIPGTDDYDYDNLTDIERSALLDTFLKDARKKWHKEHSVYNQEEERYEPDPEKYANKDYTELAKDSRVVAWLAQMMKIKDQLDSLAGDPMPKHRAPQFKASFMNRVRNRGSRLNPNSYATGIGEVIIETFCLDSEDSDYGSIFTYNDKNEDVFSNSLAYECDKIRRIPLFGVNKLKNMRQLSTDIFGSMLSYATMASRYSSMRILADVGEIGLEVLQNRQIGVTPEKNINEAERSYAYRRFSKYLQRQVYGVAQKPIFIADSKVMLNKIANFFSKLASLCYLGGNVFGGTVNWGTGATELFKEAAVGQFFDLKDFTEANLIYWKSLPSNWMQVGRRLDKDDKLSLFLRKYNAFGQDKREFREWNTYKSRAANFMFDSLVMLPYSAGDHYMQSIAYIAMAKKTKVYVRNDKGQLEEKSLWDAYYREENELEGNYKKGSGYHLAIETAFKSNSEENVETYDLITSIIQKIGRAYAFIGQNDHPEYSTFGFTQEEEDYLNDGAYDIDDLRGELVRLNSERDKFIWSADDESSFMDKAREINDRLHGIYNDQDKTVFHQNIFLNACLAMRGYALGMAQRRLGSNKYSIALGQDGVEGSLITMGKLFMRYCGTKGVVKGLYNAATIAIMPWTKGARSKMKQLGFSDYQCMNARRNWMDFLMIASYFIIQTLTAKPSGGGDDDDEEEKLKAKYEALKNSGISKEKLAVIKAADKKKLNDKKVQFSLENIDFKGITHYFAYRLLREQAAFNTAIGFTKEYQAVVNLLPVGGSILIDLCNLAYNFLGDMRYEYIDPTGYKEKDEILKDAGVSKEIRDKVIADYKKKVEEAEGQEFFREKGKRGRYEKGDPKWEYLFLRNTPYYRSLYSFFYPYESVQSYAFMRNTK